MSLNIIYASIYIFAAWKWGDWKNWQRYYPTILFLITGDLLYQYLLHDYSMWKFNPVGADKEVNLTHTHITLLIMAIKYPATVLIFFGQFPSARLKQALYIGGWAALYTINEIATYTMGGISHHNGWNFFWSAQFNLALFIITAIHHKRPLAAWGLSLAYILALWFLQDVPGKVLK